MNKDREIGQYGEGDWSIRIENLGNKNRELGE